jgi:hypothetical protein
MLRHCEISQVNAGPGSHSLWLMFPKSRALEELPVLRARSQRSLQRGLIERESRGRVEGAWVECPGPFA